MSMAGALVQDPQSPVLTAADRCDRCGAQAYVSVMHPDWPGELMFCAHHGRIHVPALRNLPKIWVHDESDRLNPV